MGRCLGADRHQYVMGAILGHSSPVHITHTRACARAHTRTRTHALTRTHTHTHTHARAYIYIYTRAHTPSLPQTHAPSSLMSVRMLASASPPRVELLESIIVVMIQA